jgi:hypothetical protein
MNLSMPPARVPNEVDFLGSTREFEHTVIEHGTVGWEDVDSHLDIGTAGAPEDGPTLVRVQLFKGRDVTRARAPAIGQGTKVLVQISWPFFVVPPKGTRVLVAFPGGDVQTPGIGMIIAAYAPSPTTQFSATRAKLDLGANLDLVIKARSVTLTDYGNRMVSLGPDGGVQAFDETGSGFQAKAGAVFGMGSQTLTLIVQSSGSVSSAINLDANGATMGSSSAMVKVKGSHVVLAGGDCAVNTKTVTLGLLATLLTPAAIVGTPGTVSTSVFISPT